jgi:hypothetical protein
MKTLAIEAAIERAKRTYFAPDARVAGGLVDADIAPVTFDTIHGWGRPAGGVFDCFEAVGTDNRNGYDLMRNITGMAYVVVAYADHANGRGLTHLKAHVAANPAWYAAQQVAWN